MMNSTCRRRTEEKEVQATSTPSAPPTRRREGRWKSKQREAELVTGRSGEPACPTVSDKSLPRRLSPPPPPPSPCHPCRDPHPLYSSISHYTPSRRLGHPGTVVDEPLGSAGLHHHHDHRHECSTTSKAGKMQSIRASISSLHDYRAISLAPRPASAKGQSIMLSTSSFFGLRSTHIPSSCLSKPLELTRP